MIFRILAKNVASVTKAAFYLSRLTFCQTKWFGEKDINTFGFPGKITSEFPWKIVGMIVKPSFWVSRRKLRGNKTCIKELIQFFFDFGREKYFKLLSKISQQSCQTAFYVSRGWIPGKLLWKNIVLRCSRTSNKNFRTFSELLYVEISIMHFTFPKAGFGRNLCLKSGRHIQGLQVVKGVGLVWKTFL